MLLHSNIISISESTVELEQGGRPLKLSNDALIVCAGGVLPTGFLKTMGIVVETKYGTV